MPRHSNSMKRGGSGTRPPRSWTAPTHVRGFNFLASPNKSPRTGELNHELSEEGMGARFMNRERKAIRAADNDDVPFVTSQCTVTDHAS